MTAPHRFTIRPRGAFALRELAEFGFGQRLRPAGVGERDAVFDGVMRLAFCLDRTWQQVGVEVRQDDAGVHCLVHGEGSLEAVEAQVARVLSLDHDATGYDQVGAGDPVIARLFAVAPGLRPPLFHSAYEAAFWAVLSARRAGWQMDRVRSALARAHGRTFLLAGTEVGALPSPEQLLALDGFEGIEPARWDRLRGVARAAADGVLDTADLRALEPDEARARACSVKGIGPFYADLIVLRALGHTDVLPTDEPRALDLVAKLYDLPGRPSRAELEAMAEPWRPWRTWCTVLLRSAGDRL